MPRRKLPSYRHHKPTDQAFVELSGKRLYLGKHGTPASRAEYKRLLAQWLGNSRRLLVAPTDITVAELLAAFLTHAELYYKRPDGASSEIQNFKTVIRLVNEAYGHIRACEFGPLALQAVRADMVARGWSRGNINRMIGRAKLIWGWGVSQEMVPEATHNALMKVSGLHRGRSEARETGPIGPAPLEHVEAVKKLASRQVRALIDLQLLTGARAGELCRMRACELDTTGKVVWEYRPSVHKTAYRGHERVVYLGPKARGIVERFLKGRAIALACKLARVPTWPPHQLRHNAATMIRRDHGLEAAQLLLGHSSALVTEAVYAERDSRKAREIAERVGSHRTVLRCCLGYRIAGFDILYGNPKQ